jgi:hypothetical protein
MAKLRAPDGQSRTALMSSSIRAPLGLTKGSPAVWNAETSPSWTPPDERDKTAKQKVAAAQVFFYGTPERSGWYLVISADGRAELTARGAPDWTQPIFTDVDQLPGQPNGADIETRAVEIGAAGAKAVDARHLARADLTPWILLFVTNDKKLRRAAARASLRRGLHVLDSLEAANRLKIEPGEAPPIAPAAGTHSPPTHGGSHPSTGNLGCAQPTKTAEPRHRPRPLITPVPRPLPPRAT